jgi:hypothetical protein
VGRISKALLLLFTAPALLYAGPREEISLSSIAAGAAERRLVAAEIAEGPGAILAQAAGAESGFPIPCATPLAQFLAQSDAPLPGVLEQARSLLSLRPVLPNEQIAPTSDGLFRIHFDRAAIAAGVRGADRDGNGLPDRVDRLKEALAAAQSSLLADRGYPSPAVGGRSVDLYLVRLGHDLEGLTVPGPDGPFILLDDALPVDRIVPAAMHQVAHASLLTLAPQAAAWWSEATASYLTLAATGDLAGVEASLRARLNAPGRGLDDDMLLLMQGGLLWPLYLTERTGDPGVLRQIWGDIAVRRVDPLSATAAVLARSKGMSLEDALREYAGWNLFTGSRDDGSHYTGGASLPEAALPLLGSGLPVALDPVEPVEPLGSVAFVLPADHSRGSLQLEIAAEGGRPAADLLVLYPGSGGRRVLVPVPVQDDGVGRVSVPWTEAVDAWILLRNDAAPGAGAARFRVSGRLDPYAPFDLAAFSADAVGDSIAVGWTTASEAGLLGWNLYRGERPNGPFSRLNAVALPAYGDGAAETGYLFVDDTARAGRRYYYLLEGLTTLGLAERSHVVSGRLAPPR